jgi:hypothetical protein
MIPPTSSTVQFTAAELPELFERALAYRFGERASGGEGQYLAGFAASGPDVAAALLATIGEVAAVAAEQDAGVVHCDVSGVMATDEGQRAWGFVALDPAASAPAEAAVTAAVERIDGGWRAEIAVVPDGETA